MESTVLYETQAGFFWNWKVALDLFFGGAGVGAFLFAVGLDVGFRGRYRRICQTAAWLAPLLVALGLGFLLLKLGRPERLVLTFTHFAPTAPLWWGGIFQTLFMFGSIAYALQWRDPEHRSAPSPTLGWVITPIAVIVGAYHGLLLAVITARPLWNTGPTVVAAMLGFASTGIAAVMLTHLLRMMFAGRLADAEHVKEFFADMTPVRNVLVAALVAQLGTFFLWWLSLRYGSLHDAQALAAANATHGNMFWWLGIGLGLVLPLILGGYAVLRRETERPRFETQLIFLTSACILIGGVFFRLAVVLAGQVPLPMSPLS